MMKKIYFHLDYFQKMEKISSLIINTMLLGKEESFKENVNLKINKKNEKEKNNEAIYKDKINSNLHKLSNDLNYGFDSSFFKMSFEKNHYEFSSKKNCVNCNNNYCSNIVIKNSTTKFSNVNNIQDKIYKYNNNKKVFCICSKSGCKLKYCECFKAKQECTNLCKCFRCENSKSQKINFNNKNNEICTANSIYIFNNILFETENLENKKVNFLNKKRKNYNFKKYQNHKTNKVNNKDENLHVNNSDKLFDENGQMIFKHSQLNQFKKYQNICF